MALASESLDPQKALIFRIVHRDNLPWIFQNGLHARNGEKQDPGFRPIGNPELIHRRVERSVPIEPFGTLSDYVPFYFTPFSIMLLNVITGRSVPRIPKGEIAILVSSLPEVARFRIPFVFTNQHAYPPLADFYNRLEQLGQVDWDLLRRRDFQHDPDDPGKKDRYQAEALVWRHLPLEALLGIGCYDESACSSIQAVADSFQANVKVRVRPHWYF